ncbi:MULTISPECIES: hypothetical protein [unclassified Sphingobacterium]|uniref:hypothetical protein n=1 Tax=unclassified Sphingobacterium TaxID=2609468 RepID=UPI00260049F2|nr:MULTISPECIES: hypothetical protein [unclassified Sphingobacterium]
MTRQKTNKSITLEIDFEKAIKNDPDIFTQPSCYRDLLYPGEQNGFPIFAITNEQDAQSSTKPSITYLKTIIEGFWESHWLDNLTIFDCFKPNRVL